MLNIADVFSNLVGLFLLIAVGYAAVKLQILPASSTKLLSNLLMRITLPATVLTSLVRPFDAAFVREGVLIVVLGTVLFALYGLLAFPAVRLCRVPQGRRGVWIFCSMFSNNGFMGFPVTIAIFGNDIFYLMVMQNIILNIYMYGAVPPILELGHKEKPNIKSTLMSMCNISMFAVIAGIIMLLTVPDDMSAAALFVLGVGFGPIYPSMVHQTPAYFGAEASPAILGMEMTAAYIGSMFMPPFFGWLGRTTTFAIFPFYALFFLILNFAVLEVKKRRRSR